jgi:hypothetical protein
MYMLIGDSQVVPASLKYMAMVGYVMLSPNILTLAVKSVSPTVTLVVSTAGLGVLEGVTEGVGV